jgi:protein ImuA
LESFAKNLSLAILIDSAGAVSLILEQIVNIMNKEAALGSPEMSRARSQILIKERGMREHARKHVDDHGWKQGSATLAALRSSIERLETYGGEAYCQRKVTLGHAEADASLKGGLALGAVHEVFAQAGRHGAAATGFIAGLAGRVAARRPVVWIRQDFIEMESGAISMNGLAELGLDPRCLVSVRALDADHALRAAADALACDAVGAVVVEVWGEARQFDLVVSRKLTLAAQASSVTGLLLRIAAEPQASTAETRWIVRAAHSPPASQPWSAWGTPLFEAQLVRNRHGPVGRWIMEWKCDECLFGQPAAYPQPVAAAPAHRPHQAGTHKNAFTRSGYRVA